MNRFFYLAAVTLLLATCARGPKKSFLRTAEIQALPQSYGDNFQCRIASSSIPDEAHLDHTQIKYLRVNFHIVGKSDGTGNFDEKTGRLFIAQVMRAANQKLANNKKMNLPVGNDTPVLPLRYRYLLSPRPEVPGDDGIYFHRDDDLYWMVSKGKDQNNYNRDVFEKYGIRKDTVLNVFVLAHPVDSLKSRTYKADQRGIAFGNWVKVKNWHNGIRDTIWQEDGTFKMNWTYWNAVKLLNHEIGHCLGLQHTWTGRDGCPDTPKHTNCWNKSKRAPCDTEWSNNVMDYNAHASAWSPCQIGKIHANFSNPNWKWRSLLEPTWCTLKPEQTITIRDTVVWRGPRDLEGHLVIAPGGYLRLGCRVSLPAGAKISIEPGGRLVLDGAELENACGEQWEGIEVGQQGEQEGTLECWPGSIIRDARQSVQLVSHSQEDS